MTILLVDDEAQILSILSETLEAAGFDVHTCTNGDDAKQYLSDHEPHILVTDLRMPGLSGLDLLKQVRQHHPDMQVIILTGYGDMKSAVEALRLGAYDYLNKPIDAKRLIQTLNNGLERRRLSIENRTLIVHLTEANRLKTEFLNGMSHEIRTPLGHITGFAEILETILPNLAEKHARYLQNIQKAARKLLTMFDDMLHYIDLNNSKTSLNPTPFNLSSLIKKTQTALQEFIQFRQLTIDLQMAVPHDIVADAEICEKMVFILLKNAVLFSPPNSRITIQATLKPAPDVSNRRRADLPARPFEHWLHLSIIDEGPGIPPHEHERIFNLFEQGNGSLNREHEGTGLGLALCKSLSLLHNGVIDLQSAPGKGSTFTIVIPVSMNNDQ